MTPMRVVVTGGAGFIGSHIVEQLAAEGRDVVVVDSLDPAAHNRPPAKLCKGVDYRWTDVTDARSWLDALDGADAVCHQAAKVGLGVDFSGLSKGEVERIWLPFMPWISVAVIGLVRRWPRDASRWLAAQAGLTIVLQATIAWPW